MTREELLLAKKSLPRLSRLILRELGPEGAALLLRVLDDTEHYGNHRIVHILEALDLDVSVWQVKVWREVGLCYRPALVPELQELRCRLGPAGLVLLPKRNPQEEERRQINEPNL